VESSSRAASRFAEGLLLRALSPIARGASPFIGFGLASTGALSVAIGLAFALHFPGRVGESVLLVAVAVTIAGEFIAPPALRATLMPPSGPETAQA
jgi:hypothetical protein